MDWGPLFYHSSDLVVHDDANSSGTISNGLAYGTVRFQNGWVIGHEIFKPWLPQLLVVEPDGCIECCRTRYVWVWHRGLALVLLVCHLLPVLRRRVHDVGVVGQYGWDDTCSNPVAFRIDVGVLELCCVVDFKWGQHVVFNICFKRWNVRGQQHICLNFAGFLFCGYSGGEFTGASAEGFNGDLRMFAGEVCDNFVDFFLRFGCV